MNGATCTNDGQDVSLYHCHCTEGYSGTNCQGILLYRLSERGCLRLYLKLMPGKSWRLNELHDQQVHSTVLKFKLLTKFKLKETDLTYPGQH